MIIQIGNILQFRIESTLHNMLKNSYIPTRKTNNSSSHHHARTHAHTHQLYIYKLSLMFTPKTSIITILFFSCQNLLQQQQQHKSLYFKFLIKYQFIIILILKKSTTKIILYTVVVLKIMFHPQYMLFVHVLINQYQLFHLLQKYEYLVVNV
jgi:hypothetical protein